METSAIFTVNIASVEELHYGPMGPAELLGSLYRIHGLVAYQRCSAAAHLSRQRASASGSPGSWLDDLHYLAHRRVSVVPHAGLPSLGST